MNERGVPIKSGDVAYLLRSLSHMRGEISAAQEAVRVLSDQLETWRTWHDDLEQELVRAFVGSVRLSGDGDGPTNMTEFATRKPKNRPG